MILTGVCIVALPPKGCHFLEHDVSKELDFVKGILQNNGWKTVETWVKTYTFQNYILRKHVFDLFKKSNKARKIGNI